MPLYSIPQLLIFDTAVFTAYLGLHFPNLDYFPGLTPPPNIRLLELPKTRRITAQFLKFLCVVIVLQVVISLY